MGKILAIAWNDIRVEFSARSTLVFFLLLPLIFTVLIGSAMGGGARPDPNADNRIGVLVVDEDDSHLSARLRETLETSTVIRPDFKSRQEADQLFADEAAPALLTIPAGFGAALLAGQSVDLSLRKAAGDNRVLAAQQAVAAAAQQVSSAVTAAQASLAEAERLRPFEGETARTAYFEQSLALASDLLADPPVRVETTRAAALNRQTTATGFEQSSPGQLVTWSMMTLVGVAELFVNDRLGGTLRRLLVTPTKKATILLGRILGRIGLGIVQMSILIGFGAAALGVDWGKSPAALVLIVLAFALAAVAFGVMLGTFVTTRSQAGWLAAMSSMLLAALGGAWWPLEVTPPIYQTVVKALPTTWAMTGFNDVVLRGQGVAEVLPEAGVLLAFAAVFFVIGVRRFRFE